MTTDTVQTATGYDWKGLLWGVAGAALIALLLAPMISRWLGISAVLAVILIGAALAFLGKTGGAVRTMGQAGVVFGLASFANNLLRPALASVPLIGGAIAGGQKAANGMNV